MKLSPRLQFAISLSIVVYLFVVMYWVLSASGPVRWLGEWISSGARDYQSFIVVLILLIPMGVGIFLLSLLSGRRWDDDFLRPFVEGFSSKPLIQDLIRSSFLLWVLAVFLVPFLPELFLGDPKPVQMTDIIEGRFPDSVAYVDLTGILVRNQQLTVTKGHFTDDYYPVRASSRETGPVAIIVCVPHPRQLDQAENGADGQVTIRGMLRRKVPPNVRAWMSDRGQPLAEDCRMLILGGSPDDTRSFLPIVLGMGLLATVWMFVSVRRKRALTARQDSARS
jgi:hypothetical protein